MFRPFIGEVLVGKISEYDDKGLQGDSVIFSLTFGLQSLIVPCLNTSMTVFSTYELFCKFLISCTADNLCIFSIPYYIHSNA